MSFLYFTEIRIIEITIWSWILRFLVTNFTMWYLQFGYFSERTSHLRLIGSSRFHALTPFYVEFFSRSVFFSLIFFFLLKQYKPHSLTHFKRQYFFPVSEKKIYSFFTHSLDFVKNVTKINLSKKKNTVPLSNLAFFSNWHNLKCKQNWSALHFSSWF